MYGDHHRHGGVGLGRSLAASTFSDTVPHAHGRLTRRAAPALVQDFVSHRSTPVDVPCETPHKQCRSRRIVLGAHEVQEGLPTPQGNEQAQVANEVICHGQTIGVRPGHKSTAPRHATYTSQAGCQKQRWYLSSGWLQIYC